MDDLIWVILEGDPRKEISEEDAEEEEYEEEGGRDEKWFLEPPWIFSIRRLKTF